MELIVAKLAAALTAAEFLCATKFYFRRRVKILSTLVMGVVLLVALILHAVYLVLAKDTPRPGVTMALVLFGLSNVLFWSALISHGPRRPSAVFGETIPEALATTGPYRLVRHPIYLAYVCGFLGSAFVGNHWILFATTLALFLCYDLAARKEERLISSDSGPIGKQYADYLRKTWRWLPFVW